jgi:S1-C subfamily serine protease
MLASSNRPRNVLFRDEINDAQNAGLAYFLQKIDLQAQCETNERIMRDCSRNDPDQKRFVGFKIVAMRPAMAWLPFDFSPGDIVTQVNGTSIEHYDTAISLFEGLAQANSLDVSVLRGSELVVVKIRIETRNRVAPRL